MFTLSKRLLALFGAVLFLTLSAAGSASAHPHEKSPFLTHDYTAQGAHSVWYNGLDSSKRFVVWIEAGQARGTVSWNGGKHSTTLSSGKLITGDLAGKGELVVQVASLPKGQSVRVIVIQMGHKAPLRRAPPRVTRR